VRDDKGEWVTRLKRISVDPKATSKYGIIDTTDEDEEKGDKQPKDEYDDYL
jgi:hypothetical protein